MKKILVSSYGCEPGKGSEQGVGWQWVLQMARYFEVVVLTRSNNRQAIESAIPEILKGNIHFEYFDYPRVAAWFKDKEKGLYFYYLLWQWGAYRLASKLNRASRFNYVMSLTFGSIWLPTFMHRLPVPFIWGPIGGGESVPFGLIKEMPLTAQIPQYLRYLLMVAIRLNPLVMGPIRRAVAVLVRTHDTGRLIPTRYTRKVRTILETAVPGEFLAAFPAPAGSHSIVSMRVIYTGRLIGLKNVSAALHAVAGASKSGVKLYFDIVGDGPERKPLEALAESLGVAGIVRFLGQIPQSQVVELLKKSDVYLFPSLKEGGVWSLMEAMAARLPVVCVNSSGMSIITDEQSAIRVDPVSKAHLISGFKCALMTLAESPELRIRLGRNARQRVERYFQWNQKGDFMRKLISELENSNT